MNKGELIEIIAQEADLSKAAAGRALEAILSNIVKTVAKKQDVQITGFGSFKAVKRPSRTGRNPSTGVAIKIAATTVPRFTAGTAFKAAVAKKKS
ncbi:MAG: HU family DNA-binding protein [Betaproteobacteria bacterium]|nr:HU family DNA-binding protein [Betaproteobacteria bacterium]NBO95981.1 HU family DNA-binding protein [Betaproteobacteria bacterium]NBP35439.1 HU family DNA-binding protein [Betaproteobacteria bacterium]NBP40222.1 HU family DNA-binding protein [Betaproteobacteria bacterium]NBQ78903.1 HU family DNA-binding protein [Betaproteobacteria bacterium]